MVLNTASPWLSLLLTVALLVFLCLPPRCLLRLGSGCSATLRRALMRASLVLTLGLRGACFRLRLSLLFSVLTPVVAVCLALPCRNRVLGILVANVRLCLRTLKSCSCGALAGGSSSLASSCDRGLRWRPCARPAPPARRFLSLVVDAGGGEGRVFCGRILGLHRKLLNS